MDSIRSVLGPGIRTQPDIKLDIHEIFDLLRVERRLLTLRILAEGEYDRGGIQLGDLAEEVAARELGIDRRSVTSQERKRVYVGLYQTHLDRLEQAGLAVTERDGLRVYPTEQTAPVVQLADDIDQAIGGATP